MALGASSDNGGVGDDSGADAAESDEGNDEDGDGDAFAPSGRATEGRGVQAGHNNVNSINYEYGSDDVYDCVDMISDSDEDGPKVEKREEKNIVESEEDGDLNTVSAHVETSDGWEGFDLDDGLFLADVPYFDEQYGRSEPGVLASEMELFKSASVFDDFTPPPLSQSPRRVRFKEPVIPASDTSDIMSDDEDLNGLFNTPEGQSMPTGAYLTSESQNNEDDEYERSSCGSSSGYESGFGDLIHSAKLILLLLS